MPAASTMRCRSEMLAKRHSPRYRPSATKITACSGKIQASVCHMSADVRLGQVEIEAQPVHRHPRERGRAHVVHEREERAGIEEGRHLGGGGATPPMIINAREQHRVNCAPCRERGNSPFGRHACARHGGERGARHQRRPHAQAFRHAPRPGDAGAGSSASGAIPRSARARSRACRASRSHRRRKEGRRARETTGATCRPRCRQCRAPRRGNRAARRRRRPGTRAPADGSRQAAGHIAAASDSAIPLGDSRYARTAA